MYTRRISNSNYGGLLLPTKINSLENLTRKILWPWKFVRLRHFPLGLLLPCDTILTAFLSSLIVAGLACADRGPWALELHTKAGNIGPTSSLYPHFHVEDCSFKINCDLVSNAKISVLFNLRTVRHHAKFTKICTDLKFPAIIIVAIICLQSNHIKPTITMLILYIRHSLVCSSNKIHSGTTFCHRISKKIVWKRFCSTNYYSKYAKNSQSKQDMEIKATSIDFSCRAAKGSKVIGCKPWVTNLSIVPHTIGILTANIT